MRRALTLKQCPLSHFVTAPLAGGSTRRAWGPLKGLSPERMCYSAAMSAKANIQTAANTDADIDRFLAHHHDEVAAKLAAARDQIARGDAAPLEPLEALLSEARERAAR